MARQDGGECGGGRRPAAGAPGLVRLPASRVLLPLKDKEKKKKESILDLSKYIDKTIRVKFQGGREGEAPASAPPNNLRKVTRGESDCCYLGTA